MENTIFFDEKKQAYDKMSMIKLNFVPIASIDEDTWAKYAGTDKWDIINGQFEIITEDKIANKDTNITDNITEIIPTETVGE